MELQSLPKKRGRKPKVKEAILEPIERETPLTRGIVIFALGSPQYGRMAANLAASIRVCDKEVNICLIHTTDAVTHLTPQHKDLFTEMQLCPPSAITKNGQLNYLKAKTCVYDLTPYYETLMIDADVLWFGKRTPTQMMLQMGCDFTMQVRGFTEGGYSKYTYWAGVDAIRKAYGITGKIHQTSSEVVYFKKTEKSKQLFELVKEIYNSPKVKSDMTFMGDIPDELAFNIATAKLGIYPRKDVEVFIHWQSMDLVTTAWDSIVKGYYGMSIGGNNIPSRVLQRYHQLARAQAQALKLPFNYNVYPKRQWDAQRKSV